MFYGLLSSISGIFCLVLIFFGLRLLIRRGWVAGFLRGVSGVGFIAAALLIALVALDLYSYQQMITDKPIATISFVKVDEFTYKATLVFTDSGKTQDYELKGDQWQLDARVIRWKGAFRAIGGKPGYRLDRISGRYLSLEDERLRERTVYSLGEKELGPDLWAWVHKKKEAMPWVEAAYGSATFVPMVDGGLYEVALSNSGLVAKPLNTAAKNAVSFWQ